MQSKDRPHFLNIHQSRYHHLCMPMRTFWYSNINQSVDQAGVHKEAAQLHERLARMVCSIHANVVSRTLSVVKVVHVVLALVKWCRQRKERVRPMLTIFVVSSWMVVCAGAKMQSIGTYLTIQKGGRCLQVRRRKDANRFVPVCRTSEDDDC